MKFVRAKLARLPQDWKWSSARAHLKGKDDRPVKVKPLLEMGDDWRAYLHESDEAWDSIRRHERTGRPLGSLHFVADLEKMTGRELAKRPPGPKQRRSRR
jgi:putative transposase